MMTVFRKPWLSVSSARTAGRCHPAWHPQGTTPLSCYNFDQCVHLWIRYYFLFFCFAQNFIGFADSKNPLPLIDETGTIRKSFNNILAVHQHHPAKLWHGAPLLNRPPGSSPQYNPHSGSQIRVRLVVLFSEFHPPLPFRAGERTLPRRMQSAYIRLPYLSRL